VELQAPCRADPCTQRALCAGKRDVCIQCSATGLSRPRLKPQTSNLKPQTSNLKPQTFPLAPENMPLQNYTIQRFQPLKGDFSEMTKIYCNNRYGNRRSFFEKRNRKTMS
jgi:hypothetical protein